MLKVSVALLFSQMSSGFEVSIASGCLLLTLLMIGAYIGTSTTWAWRVVGWLKREAQRLRSHMQRKPRSYIDPLLDTIVIPESPPPTCSASSPFPASPTTSMRRRARRAGRARMGRVRRTATRIFSPRTADDCAYACALRLAGLKADTQSIQQLRCIVSKIVEKSFLEDLRLGGLSIREEIQRLQLNINSYTAQIRHRQWASQIEVDAALKALGVKTYLSIDKHQVIIAGEGHFIPAVIRLTDKHYSLYRLHRPLGQPLGSPKRHQSQRGGMEHPPPPRWEELRAKRRPPSPISVVTFNPPVEDERHNTVYLPQHWLARIPVHVMVFKQQITVGQLKRYIGNLGDWDDAFLILLDPNAPTLQEFPDWVPLPRRMELAGEAKPKFLRFELESTHQEFYFKPRWEETHVQLLDRISDIIMEPVEAIVMTKKNSTQESPRPWIFPHAAEEEPEAVISILPSAMDLPGPSQQTALAIQDVPRGGGVCAQCEILDENYYWDEIYRMLEPYYHALYLMTDDHLVLDEDEEHAEHGTESDSPRGGMRKEASRSRSREPRLSPTVPFQSTSQEQPHGDLPQQEFAEHGQLQQSEQQPAPLPPGPPTNQQCQPPEPEQDDEEEEGQQRERHELRDLDEHGATPPRRAPSDDSRMSIVASPDIWAYVWPPSPPAAQPRMHRRPIMYAGRNIGTCWAPLDAYTYEIIAFVDTRIRPEGDIVSSPLDARTWRQAHYLHIQRVHVDMGEPNLIDLRRGVWEQVHPVRHVPIIGSTGLEGRAILSTRLSPERCQPRLERNAPWNYTYTLHVIGDVWIIISQELPAEVQESLHRLACYEEWDENAWAPRGGAHTQQSMAQEVTGDRPSLPQELLRDLEGEAANDVPTQIVLVKIPPTQERIVLLRMPLHLTVQEAGDRAEQQFHMPKGSCKIQSAAPTGALLPNVPVPRAIPPTCAAAMRMLKISKPTAETETVYMPKLWNVETLKNYYKEMTGDMNICIKQRGRELSPERRLADLHGDDTQLCDGSHEGAVRGGARSPRPQDSHQQRRQEMQGWALQRLQENLPSLDSKLMKTLLKAENRTVSAVLNARSPMQLVHIASAALKRASLYDRATALEQHVKTHGLNKPQQEAEDVETKSEAPLQPMAGQDLPPPTSAQPSNLASNEIETIQQDVKNIVAAIQQMQILLQHQYMAAFNYDITPIVMQVDALQRVTTDSLRKNTETIAEIQHKVTQWEETYLPAIMDRLQQIHPLPTTPPPSESDQPMLPLNDVDTLPMPKQPTVSPDSPAQQGVIEEGPMSRFENKYMQACARKALMPFKAAP